jgi:triose/dihydroxyacetone kinase / FAD-AMP lyase (cyclizing)
MIHLCIAAVHVGRYLSTSANVYVNLRAFKNKQHTSKIAVISELLKHADDLGAKDAITGDGDFGTTLRTGCGALSAMVENGDMDTVDDGATVCQVIAEATGASMGGTSGNLTSTFFEACSRAYAVSRDWRQAFIAGTDAVSSVGHAKIGDRTLIDALQPAADVLSKGGSAVVAAESARLGANSTALLTTAKFGRSSHVSSENLMGVVDPGAEAVAIAIRAYAAACRCLELGEPSGRVSR